MDRDCVCRCEGVGQNRVSLRRREEALSLLFLRLTTYKVGTSLALQANAVRLISSALPLSYAETHERNRTSDIQTVVGP